MNYEDQIERQRKIIERSFHECRSKSFAHHPFLH